MKKDQSGWKWVHFWVAFLTMMLIAPPHLFAMPKGGQVQSGNAQISQPDLNNMNISQGTNKAIINWQSFSIAHPEAVRFSQPGASSIALNRVVGGDPSAIYGLLSANGRIYLINPNGIMVGPTGVINVNSFIASTLDISNEDFLNGNHVFSQNLGQSLSRIVNQGTITAANGGFVSLIAPSVQNQGTIIANMGKVYIGGGERVTLNFDGENLISFAVEEKVKGVVLGEGGEPVETVVNNTGLISAEGGEVILSGKSALDAIKAVVNNDGVIMARSLVNENGVVKLLGGDEGVVANSGIIDASGKEAGAKGGTVQVLGDKVGLFGSGSIDVSGDAGGGTVLVGGDFQGKNPNIQNASRTYVGPEFSIKADALTNGDGGRVIVWSDDLTKFYGTISARGGLEGGDGGFAEVSGKNSLVYRGTTDLRAPYGKVGTLLLDPANIQITGGTADGDDDTNASDSQLINDAAGGSNTAGTIVFADEGAGSPDPFIVYESEIEGQSASAHIVLEARVAITTSGDFTNDDVLLAAGHNLTLRTRNTAADGAGSINLTGSDDGINLLFRTQGNGTITIAGSTSTEAAGNIILGKLQSDTGTINVSTNNGTITLKNNITTGGGDAVFRGVGVTQLDGSTVDATAGTILIDANDGAVDLAGLLTTTNNTATAVQIIDATTAKLGNVTAADGTLVLGGALGDNLSGAVTQNAGTVLEVATLKGNTGDAVTLGNNNKIGNLGAFTSSGNFQLKDTTGGLNLTGALTTNGGNVAIDTTGVGAMISVQAGISSGAGNVTLDSDGLTTINAAGDIVTTTGSVTFGGTRAGALTTAGDVTTGGGFVRFARAVTLNGPVSINTGAGAGDITFNSTVEGTQNLTLAAGTGSIKFEDVVGGNVGGLGALTINSGSGGVTADKELTAASVSISNGGAVVLKGKVTAPGGFSSAGSSFNNQAEVVTTNAGITINHGGAVTLGGALTSNGGAVDIDAGSISINAAVNAGGGNVSLNSGGAVTQTASITAAGLELLGAGSFDLTDVNNDVNTFAANTTNTIEFTNKGDLEIGTVNATAGLTSTADVILIAGGAVTQSQKVFVPTLTVETRNDAGASITLDNVDNEVTTLNLSAMNAAGASSAGGAIEYVDKDDIEIGLVGIKTASSLSLTAGEDIEGPGTIVVQSADVSAVTIGMTSRPAFDVNGDNFKLTLTGKDAMGMSGKIDWAAGKALPPAGNINAPGAVIIGSFTYGIAEIEAVTAAIGTASTMQALIEGAIAASTQADFFTIPPTLINIMLEEDETTTFFRGLPIFVDEPSPLFEEARNSRLDLVYLINK